jgi:hypothetical protein
VKYLHQCCHSRTTSAFIKAIDNNFLTTWPGLTSDLVRKHLPKLDATIKGHLRQTFKNKRSTNKMIVPAPTPSISQEPTPTPTRTNHVYVSAIEATGKIYMDQTGESIVSLVVQFVSLLG